MNTFCKAYEIMKRRGWQQGPWYTDDGPICLLQACALARRTNESDPLEVYSNDPSSVVSRDAKTLLKYLPKGFIETGCATYKVWMINDSPHFDESQALAALKAACEGETDGRRME